MKLSRYDSADTIGIVGELAGRRPNSLGQVAGLSRSLVEYPVMASISDVGLKTLPWLELFGPSGSVWYLLRTEDSIDSMHWSSISIQDRKR